MATETVSVVEATGNIGTSAVIGALRSKRNVLAVFRNQDSAASLTRNMFNHVGSTEVITFAETDVLLDMGIEDIVDQDGGGELPSFQQDEQGRDISGWLAEKTTMTFPDIACA